MSETQLRKSVKLTPTSHRRLREACKAKYGTEKIRFSDVIEQLCNEEIDRQTEGEE